MGREGEDGVRDNRLPFPEPWSAEFATLCLALLYHLLHTKMLHLGAKGSHFIEHLFVLIRSLCRGDESHEAFLRAFLRVAVKMQVLRELGIKQATPSRRNDSRCRLSEADLPDPKVVPFADRYVQSLQFLAICFPRMCEWGQEGVE
jgi:hypothetical protein